MVVVKPFAHAVHLARAHRLILARALALAAVLSMILSAAAFRPQLESLAHYRPTPGPRDYYNPLAPWFFLAGALALAGALIAAPRTPHPLAPSPSNGEGEKVIRSTVRWSALDRWTWVLIVPGVLSLLMMAEANGALIGFRPAQHMRPLEQFALLVEGVVMIVIGLGGLPRRSPRADEKSAGAPLAGTPPAGLSAALARVFKSEIVFVVLITLLALGIRFWHLGSSVRMMIDEGHFALGTAYFWTFPDVKLLEPMPTSASFPFIYSYGQSGMVALFGRNFLGLRALSALLGTLTVPALYLLARELFDRRTAVIAALVLLTFPPQVHYSRLALNNIADPFFGTLALGLLARAVRTRRRFDYVLGGAILGFTQYFYEGGRLLYPALAAAWLLIGLLLWRRRPSVRGMIGAALAFVLVAAPVYYALTGLHFPLTDRLDKTEYDQFYWGYHREPNDLHTRLVHFRHSLMVYVNAPENTSFNYYLYYGGRYPLILPVIVPLFLLGLVIAAWRWRTPGVLPLGWVFATSLGNAMLVESAVSARYVVVFPGLALLIALGIRYTPGLFHLPRRTERGQTGFMLALAGIVALVQGYYYFGPFLDLFNHEARQAVAYDVDNAMLRSARFPPGTRIFVIAYPTLPEGDAQRLLNFLADDLTVFVFRPDSFGTLDLVNLSRDTDLAFFIAANDSATLARLEMIYGVRVLQPSPYPVPDGKALLLFYVGRQG